jgi:hypothetical protein
MSSLFDFSSHIRKLTSEKKNPGKRNLLNRLSFFIIKHFRIIPKIALGVTVIIGLGIFFLQVDYLPVLHTIVKKDKLRNKLTTNFENVTINYLKSQVFYDIVS